MKRCKKWISIVLALMLLLSGCSNRGAGDPTTDTTAPGTRPAGNLICVEISRFSGGFVEDGSDTQVQDVAAILVANNTGKFLELATVTYQVGDRTAVFRVTGLPSGKRAWVLESNRLTLSDGDELVLEDCQETYNPNAILFSDALEVSRQGHSLTLTNISDKRLSNVVVYYKNTLKDGSYMGGITYFISFGDLAPGDSVTKAKDHFGDNSEIVRFSYQ